MADGTFVPISRPTAPAPGRDAAETERAEWAEAFVIWLIEITGGENMEVEPLGHRWRMEYALCVPDPAAYERSVEKEIELATQSGAPNPNTRSTQ